MERDCCQSGVNPATIVHRDKPDQNWIDDEMGAGTREQASKKHLELLISFGLHNVFLSLAVTIF